MPTTSTHPEHASAAQRHTATDRSCSPPTCVPTKPGGHCSGRVQSGQAVLRCCGAWSRPGSCRGTGWPACLTATACTCRRWCGHDPAGPSAAAAARPRPSPQTYAAWPVWSDSTTAPVRFAPLAKKAAVRLWHRARDFDRTTRQPGRHGGALGHTGLQVLHALVFDFLNFATGRLDPSYAAIARKANVCERTVATALARLKELGILHWVRR